MIFHFFWGFLFLAVWVATPAVFADKAARAFLFEGTAAAGAGEPGGGKRAALASGSEVWRDLTEMAVSKGRQSSEW